MFVNQTGMRIDMAKAPATKKKPLARRPWTKDDVRLLKGMARKEPASAIAKALKRTEGATRQKATALSISLNLSKKKAAPAKKAVPAKKAAPVKKVAAKPAAPVKKVAAAKKTAPVAKAPEPKKAAAKKAAPVKKAAAKKPVPVETKPVDETV